MPRIEKGAKVSKRGTNTIRSCTACGAPMDIGQRVMLTIGWESVAGSGQAAHPVRSSHSQFICKSCAYKALDTLGLER